MSTLTQDQRPSFARVTGVELRKMTDTRSGFWLPIAVLFLTLVVAVLGSVLQHGQNGTYLQVIQATATPCYLLLPVIGVLLVCGEWTQRTTLTTFVLVPHRGRVIAAKLAASLVAATVGWLAVVIFTVLFTSLFGNAIGGTGPVPWVVIGQTWVYLALAMLIGLGFGSAFLISAPAIIAFYLLPIAWDAILSIHALNGIAIWLDSSNTFAYLTQYRLTATNWAHVGTTAAVFIGIPMAIGALRLSRGDID